MYLSLKPQFIYEKQSKLQAFPFSLSDKAKDWLFYLPPRSNTTKTNIVKLYLGKFFPALRVVSIRREIYGIKQKDLES